MSCVSGATNVLVAIVARDGFLAVVGEDDAGLLAAVDLGFSGELAADQVDGASGM